MYSKIAKLIDMGKWELAEKEFKLHISDEWTDELAILAAVIYLHNEQRDEAFESIRRGLQYNYRNYELYLILGNYYESNNINQAWLCYENAEFYCDNQEDLEIIRGYKKRLEKEKEWCVRPTSIVILSYNLKSVMKQCIESVRQNNPASSYEIIVVDNNSTDGVKEWLKEQKDIKLICNSENKGFPYGCNQGIKLAEQENNIFLLNNDTIVLPNSLFILRLGLYENGRVGATGSVTNFMGNEQLITEKYDTVEQYISYGIKHNLPEKNPYERKVFLCGFALLLKREALDSIGLLDTRFSPGQYEDDDIGVRLNYAGWLVLLCRNSFILHYGSGGGNSLTKVEALDGLLLVTRYDIPWREDLFDGWDFYDISQCLEMQRAGYQVAVPFQTEPWCYHDNTYSKMQNYQKYCDRMISEYQDIKPFYRVEPSDNKKELNLLKETSRKELKKLIENENKKELIQIFDKPENRGWIHLRDFEVLADITKNELAAGETLLWTTGDNYEDIWKRIRSLHFKLKRLEYDVESRDEVIQECLQRYTMEAIKIVLGRILINRNYFGSRFKDIIEEDENSNGKDGVGEFHRYIFIF